MAVSTEVRDLVRALTTGYSEAEVLRRTGLSLITHQRLRTGILCSDKLLIQFATGMDADPNLFLRAAAKVRQPVSQQRMAEYLIESSGLSGARRARLLEVYHELLEEERHQADKQSAA